MFDPDEYYISLSKKAGDDLRKFCYVREELTKSEDIANIKKVFVAGMGGFVEWEDNREMHVFGIVNLFGEDVGVWAIIKTGSPAGIQDRTVTIRRVVPAEFAYKYFATSRRHIMDIFKEFDESTN